MILLTPPPPDGEGVTDSLKSDFEARDWFAVEQTDPYLAMAELCLRERSQTARAAWGLQRMEQVALVIAPPQYWPQLLLQELIAAVAQHLPAASIWEAKDGSLQAIQDSPSLDPNPKSKIPNPKSMLEPRLAHPKPESLGDDASRSRLTREEIDMLLAVDPAVSNGTQP